MGSGATKKLRGSYKELHALEQKNRNSVLVGTPWKAPARPYSSPRFGPSPDTLTTNLALLCWGSAPQPSPTPLWGIRQASAFSLTQSGWNRRSRKVSVTICTKADIFTKVLFHSGEVLLRASHNHLLILLNRRVRESRGLLMLIVVH